MPDLDLNQLLISLDGIDEPAEDNSVTRLLHLAAALNAWDYPCVARIECGYSVQDANYVGDIEMLLGNARGTWHMTVLPSRFGNLITIIDPDHVVDAARERELRTIFEKFGYTYVPAKVLSKAYRGGSYATWFDRYFSWG